MMKKIKDFLKRLFDYQKFEKNPKLDQTIQDSLKGESLPASELDLSNVMGAGSDNIADILGNKCPSCGHEGSYHKVTDPNTGSVMYYCSNCNYSEKDNTK